MASWTVCVVAQTCGACGDVIPPNQPICELMKGQITRPKLRCATCAQRQGFPLDAQQVDDARFELERQRFATEETPLTPAQYMARAVTRVKPPRRTRSAAEIAAKYSLPDHKRAAAGE